MRGPDELTLRLNAHCSFRNYLCFRVRPSILTILMVKVKLSLCDSTKTYWGSGDSSTHSLTSALDGGEWSASRPGRFTPRERAPGLGGPRGRSGRGVYAIPVNFNACNISDALWIPFATSWIFLGFPTAEKPSTYGK
jgi:hypothetical protein